MPAKSPTPLIKIGVRIEADDDELLRAIAEARSLQINQVVREAVHSYCDRVRRQLMGQNGAAQPTALLGEDTA